MSGNAQAANALPLAREGSEWMVDAGREAVRQGKLSEGAYVKLCDLSKDWCTGQTAYAALKAEHEALKKEHEELDDAHEDLLGELEDSKGNAIWLRLDLEYLRAKYNVPEDAEVQCQLCHKMVKDVICLHNHMMHSHPRSSE